MTDSQIMTDPELAMPLRGHSFDPLTRMCACGMSAQRLEDSRRASTHGDLLHPGTRFAASRNRATGHIVHFRKRL